MYLKKHQYHDANKYHIHTKKITADAAAAVYRSVCVQWFSYTTSVSDYMPGLTMMINT